MMNVYKKYHKNSVLDTGYYVSDEAKEFMKYFEKRLKASLKNTNMELVKFSYGHYDISGYIKNENNNYVYFSYSIPRDNKLMDLSATDIFDGINIRLEKDAKYGGIDNCGINNSTNIKNFIEDVQIMLDSGDFKKWFNFERERWIKARNAA